MTLGRAMILGLVVFLVGLLALYSGVNRAPFKQAPQPQHPMKMHGKAAVETVKADTMIGFPG